MVVPVDLRQLNIVSEVPSLNLNTSPMRVELRAKNGNACRWKTLKEIKHYENHVFIKVF